MYSTVKYHEESSVKVILFLFDITGSRFLAIQNPNTGTYSAPIETYEPRTDENLFYTALTAYVKFLHLIPPTIYTECTHHIHLPMLQTHVFFARMAISWDDYFSTVTGMPVMMRNSSKDGMAWVDYQRAVLSADIRLSPLTVKCIKSVQVVNELEARRLQETLTTLYPRPFAKSLVYKKQAGIVYAEVGKMVEQATLCLNEDYKTFSLHH